MVPHEIGTDYIQCSFLASTYLMESNDARTKNMSFSMSFSNSYNNLYTPNDVECVRVRASHGVGRRLATICTVAGKSKPPMLAYFHPTVICFFCTRRFAACKINPVAQEELG